jgi:hypothetical protein
LFNLKGINGMKGGKFGVEEVRPKIHGEDNG